jgi:hypothetical protein
MNNHTGHFNIKHLHNTSYKQLTLNAPNSIFIVASSVLEYTLVLFEKKKRKHKLSEEINT